VTLAVAVRPVGVGGITIVTGFTTTLTFAVASVVPAFEQVMTYLYVPAARPLLTSVPPVAVLVPVQAFDAVHEVGVPVVVHFKVVELTGRVIVLGTADKTTEIAPTTVVLNVAVQDFAASIVTEPSVQSALPVHPTKVDDAFGVAVKATTAPELYVVPLVGATVPVPVPAFIIVRANLQTGATVPEADGDRAEDPTEFVALTLYVWVDPKTRPVSENAVAEPLYTAVAPPSLYT